MTKTLLLTLVTAVMLMPGCLGLKYTVKCISQAEGKEEYEPAMVKFGTRDAPLNDSQVFEIVPDTDNPPEIIEITDMRPGVIKGCRIHLIVKGLV